MYAWAKTSVNRMVTLVFINIAFMCAMFYTQTLYAQDNTLDSLGQEILTGISISRDDDFTSWDFFGVDDYPVGHLRLRWPQAPDWTEWDFRIGDHTGQIALRDKKNPNVWELKSQGKYLTMKTIYHNDFNQWQITDDSKIITFKTVYENIYDGWKGGNNQMGEYEIYTQWEMDPRDWIVYDKLKIPLDQNFKIAMMFLASFYSSPKY